jgi:hypothetical protein
MTEQVFDLPNGRAWHVCAFEYPTDERARSVWEAWELASRGSGHNFSLWRSTNPEHTIHLVIMCGYPEDLPEIEGTPYELTWDEAKMFALRRARVGLDANEAGFSGHIEQMQRYGDSGGVVIDPTTGNVEPYRPA